MKIIFLDIDGVLNVIPTGFDKFGPTFHDHFVENLKHLLQETGAKLVISSSWKHSGLKTMKDMWKYRNLPGEVIDITPDCQYVVDELGKMRYYDEVSRGAWLDKHDNIENYVIIDDDNDMLESQQNNFVKTSGNSKHPDKVDIGYGLTKICTEKAIQILNV